MRLVQVLDPELGRRAGVDQDGEVYDLTAIDPDSASSVVTLIGASADSSLSSIVEKLISGADPRPSWRYEELNRMPGSHPHLIAPVDAPEVWAAGVTYERSRVARELESEGASRFYAMVYVAERPELFLKTSNMLRVAGPYESIGIRSDSKWTVPEPELAVVIGAQGEIVGYTIANDVSARDIEGENPLYLSQAKIFRGCCSLGPALLVADDSTNPLEWTVKLRIESKEHGTISEEISLSKMQRSLESLVSYVVRDNDILPGTVLMTGTGIVPADDFSLRDGDVVEISIEPIGVLHNVAVELGLSDP